MPLRLTVMIFDRTRKETPCIRGIMKAITRIIITVCVEGVRRPPGSELSTMHDSSLVSTVIQMLYGAEDR
jgi:hypothetical protein